MTGQVPDVVQVDGVDWMLVGIDGRGLFDPSDAGVHPMMLHTACWRGFINHYLITGGRMLLAWVEIGLTGEEEEQARAGTGPLIDGTRPIWQDDRRRWEYQFDERVVPFTGTLLLGRDLVREHYVHMGFQDIWKHEHVLAVELDEGRVLSLADHSDHFAKVRATMRPGQDRPAAGASRLDVERWIRQTFDQTVGRLRVGRLKPPDEGHEQ